MGLWGLLVSASMPILKLLLVTGLGAFLATNRVGILGEDARKNLNLVVFFVFNPSFVYYNLSSTITFKQMISLWFMPVNIILTFIFGSVLGWVVMQVTRAPSHLRSVIFGCCSAGNLGYLLLIIIPTICKDKHSPFGDPNVCNKLGMAYSSLSMALGGFFIWMYVYNVIRIITSKRTKEAEMNGSSVSTTELPTTGHLEDHFAPSTKSEESYRKLKVSVLLKQIIIKISGENLKKAFAPTTIGAIVGFIVGMIPQIRRTLIGDSAPLRVIQDSTFLLGNGAIPAVILILGGNLLKGLRGSDIRVVIIIGIIITRYIALPLLGIGVVKGAIYLGLVHSDPLYQFILLLQFALPPAMNISTMLQLFGVGESECSVIFLWAYLLASVSLTLWSTFFMWLVS